MTVKQVIPLPSATGPTQQVPTCADILAETVEAHPGVAAAVVDHQQTTLTLNYNPTLISAAEADKIAVALSRRINRREAACNSAHAVRCIDCVALTPHDEVHEHVAVLVDDGQVPAELKKHLSLTDGSLAKIEKRYRQLGRVGPVTEPEESWLVKNLETILAGLSLLTLAGGLVAGVLGYARPIQVAFFGLSYAAGGYTGLTQGIKSLREFSFDVNFLMLAAAIGAATIGAWEEGAILLFLFSLSGALESYAMDRTRSAIEKLMDLTPAEALVKQGQAEVLVPVEALEIGDVIIIKPGERVAADGQVLTGQSEIDQSPITGESIPVNKKAGDPVFAGTINGQGALEATVTKLAQDSTLAKTIQLVSEAQSQRSPTQRAIDWFGSRYTVAVILGTLAMIFIPYLLLGWEFSPAFYRGMTLLVVASPCALVISTPASVLSAIANAARHGILFKGGAHLENTAKVKVVAFDKTGTLTNGEPSVTEIIPLNGWAEADLLSLTAAAELRSEHHLAKAVVQAARQRQLSIPETEEFQALMGRGAQAHVDGHEIKVGKPSLFAGHGPSDDLAETIESLERQGKTVMLVSRDDQLIGAIAVADTVRPAAKAVVAQLKRVGIERVVMLTGDNERTAQTIAEQAGVDEFYAGLLPQDKVRLLKELEQKYGPVAMVGDGVNDAPALATATVGVAMGAAGTDVALETADVVLMADDLTKLPYAIDLSRRSERIIKQNLAFAGLVIILLISSAVFGLVPLPLGVVGHEGSTLLVVMNGLRLLRSNQQPLQVKLPSN
jgi:Cd2+/Zn2+-exporting ATPase